ncbi:NADPH-dependent F420 reductase [Terrabacter terrigena]|uniref:NADPH-dependent F420 reductase n=1 Tax=Terrabacter terrigena TaxID=574718 RepID=A0ABW3N385_9MICO
MTTIGTIGAGNIGSAIARLAAGAGHAVVLSNSRGPATLIQQAQALGSHVTAGTTQDAATADIVVVTVPLSRLWALPEDLLQGKIVVDTMNYYPARDGVISELEDRRTTTSLMTAHHFIGARVVKAFNNIISTHLIKLAAPQGAPHRSALPVASDQAEAKAEVARLIDDLGYDPLDAGSLTDSWRFENGQPAYCLPYAADPAALLASSPGSRPLATRPASVGDITAALSRASRA